MKKYSGLFIAAGVVAATVLQGCAVEQFHTQQFAEGEVDLEGQQLYFMPVDDEEFESGYFRFVQEDSTLPEDPQDPNAVEIGQDVVGVELEDEILFYGKRIGTIYLNYDGTIGMGEAPGDNQSLQSHFMQPQVSVAAIEGFGDNGAVTVAQEKGNVVSVSYRDMVAGGGEPANVMAEFFVTDEETAKQIPDSPRDGDIALTYEQISANAAGVYGLSEGGFSEDEIDEIVAGFGNQAPLSVGVMTGTAL